MSFQYTLAVSLTILAITVTGGLIYGVLLIGRLVGLAALVVALALVANVW